MVSWPIRIEMSPIELNLGALIALRVGDVLRTPHHLHVPLIVKGFAKADEASADSLCFGFLGKQEGHRAVELSRRADPD